MVNTDGTVTATGEPGRRDALLPAPRVQNHAANLAVLPDGALGCVWFAGTQEGVPDISVWFSRLDDVIRRANSVPFGLASYVFTHDDALAGLTAEGIDAGMVGVNETMLETAEAPFGGIKESGFGREGGSLGIIDYLEPKYIRHRLAVRGAL